MGEKSFEKFRQGDEVYFVSEMAVTISHLRGALLEDITTDTKEIWLLNGDGEKISVGSKIDPEWSLVEGFDGFGLLFLKKDSERVVYVVVSKDEDNIMLEPDLGF